MEDELNTDKLQELDGAQAALQQLTAQLAKQQQQQQALQQQRPPAAPAEPTFFGMTMGALFVGFVLSTIGLGYLRFARSEAEPLLALFGLAMIIVPFFVTTTLPLLAAGIALIASSLVLRRVLNGGASRL